LSYRTNRRTGGTFRTRDYTPSELESQSRRYTCPRCEALMGRDISPTTAAMESRMSGHEIAGTPISSFISRAELNEHIRRVHPGSRLPTKTHRRLGRSVNVNITNTNTAPATEPMSATEAPDTMTAPSTETQEEIAEDREAGIGDESGEGFTDDDGQIFDGHGGLLDNGGEEESEEDTKGGLLD
jgi:hypothetical protein